MKKVLSLVLVAVLAIGMGLTGFAAWSEAYEVKGFDSDTTTLADFYITDGPALGDVLAVDEKEVVINLNWTDGKNPATDDADGYTNFDVVDKSGAAVVGVVPGDKITKNMLDKGKVTVKVRYSKGSQVIDEVKLDKAKQTIKITFVDEYVSTSSLDFEFSVYLQFDGKGSNTKGVTIDGTFKNETVDIEEDTSDIYLADQIIAKPETSLRDVTLDLGNGVEMVKVRLAKDKKYYGTATTETTDADEDLRDEYGFSEVYTLKTIGLSMSGNYVKLTELGRSDYVYSFEGGNLVFVGMGNETLPYYTQYFISTTELSIASEVEPADDEPADDEPAEDEDPSETTPDLGGDDVAATNANFNPGTGA